MSQLASKLRTGSGQVAPPWGPCCKANHLRKRTPCNLLTGPPRPPINRNAQPHSCHRSEPAPQDSSVLFFMARAFGCTKLLQPCLGRLIFAQGGRSLSNSHPQALGSPPRLAPNSRQGAFPKASKIGLELRTYRPESPASPEHQVCTAGRWALYDPLGRGS